MRSNTRPWWIIDLTLLTGLAAFAGLAISQSLAARMHDASSVPQVEPTGAALSTDRPDPGVWVTRILNRDVFDSTPPVSDQPTAPAAPDDSPRAGPPGPGAPCAPEAGLELVATMVADAETASRAVVRRGRGHGDERRIVRPGVRLDDGVVTAIYRERAVIRRGHTYTCLELGARRPRAASAAPRPGTSGSGSVRPGTVRRGKEAEYVRRIGARHYAIDEAGFKAMLDNPKGLGRQIRVRPHRKNGQPAGFEVTRVKRGGVFDALGLEPKDVLRGMNGERVDNAIQALELYETLRTSRRATLEVERRGRPIAIEYELR